MELNDAGCIRRAQQLSPLDVQFLRRLHMTRDIDPQIVIRKPASVKVKAYLSVQLRRHWLIMIVSGFESPEGENVESLLVKAHTQRARNGRSMHSAVCADIKRHYQRTLIFTPSRLFAELRFNGKEGFGCISPG